MMNYLKAIATVFLMIFMFVFGSIIFPIIIAAIVILALKEVLDSESKRKNYRG